MDRKKVSSLLLICAPFMTLIGFLIPLQVTQSWYNNRFGPVLGYQLLIPSRDLRQWWGGTTVTIGLVIMWLSFLFVLGLFLLSLLVAYNESKGASMKPLLKYAILGGSFFVTLLYLLAGIVSLIYCSDSYSPWTLSFIPAIIVGGIDVLYFLMARRA